MGVQTPVKYHCSCCFFAHSEKLILYNVRSFVIKEDLALSNLCGGQSQEGSLAGAVYLLQGNADVLR